MSSAYNYIKEYGTGLTSDYPYTARDESCKRSSEGTRVRILGHEDFGSGTVTRLSEWLSEGPVAIALEV